MVVLTVSTPKTRALSPEEQAEQKRRKLYPRQIMGYFNDPDVERIDLAARIIGSTKAQVIRQGTREFCDRVLKAHPEAQEPPT